MYLQIAREYNILLDIAFIKYEAKQRHKEKLIRTHTRCVCEVSCLYSLHIFSYNWSERTLTLQCLQVILKHLFGFSL